MAGGGKGTATYHTGQATRARHEARGADANYLRQQLQAERSMKRGNGVRSVQKAAKAGRFGTAPAAGALRAAAPKSSKHAVGASLLNVAAKGRLVSSTPKERAARLGERRAEARHWKAEADKHPTNTYKHHEALAKHHDAMMAFHAAQTHGADGKKHAKASEKHSNAADKHYRKIW